MNAHGAAGRVNVKNDRRDRRQENLTSIRVSNHINIVRAGFKDLHQFAKRSALLILHCKSKKLVLINPALRQTWHIRRPDVHPLVAEPTRLFRRLDPFKLDQHPFRMRAHARKCHRCTLFANEQLFTALQPLGKIGMYIHNDLAVHAVRPAQESNHQIDRLAVWRAWSILRVSHYCGSTTSRVACLPSRSAATRRSVRMELATLPPLPITRPISSFETLSSIRTRDPPPLCRTCTSSG